MDPDLDPQVRYAVEHPAQTARGPEEVQLRVRLAGEPARRALDTHWDDVPEDAAPDDDRLAAAVLLATLFGDTSRLERAARLPGDVPGSPSAPPSGLLELTTVPGARAALGPVLERSLLTGLLEWATNPLPEQPPLAVARAARDLGIPDEGRVFKVVRRRAERFLAREHDGSPELERFVALLAEAERGHRGDGPVLTGETLPPAPPPAGPQPYSPPPALGDPGGDVAPPGATPPGATPPGAPVSDAPEAPRWGVSPATPAPPPAGQPPGREPSGPGGWLPPAGPGAGEDDTDSLKAWGLLFLAIVAVIVVLIFVL